MTDEAGPEPRPRSTQAASLRVPWARIFAGEAVQVGEVRHWIQRLLPECEPLDELLVLVTELCTNAIKHTRSGLPGGWFSVHVTWARTFVRVMVTDHGSASEPVVNRDLLSVVDGKGSGDFEDFGGRGLLLVEELSVAWGTGGDSCGRFVWFDIRWPERLGPAAPARAWVMPAPPTQAGYRGRHGPAGAALPW